MARTVIDKRVFDGVKKALKGEATYKTITKYFEVSSESIRRIKNCSTWSQWNQDKVNRNVLINNRKYLQNRSLLQRLVDFFNG